MAAVGSVAARKAVQKDRLQRLEPHVYLHHEQSKSWAKRVVFATTGAVPLTSRPLAVKDAAG